MKMMKGFRYTSSRGICEVFPIFWRGDVIFTAGDLLVSLEPSCNSRRKLEGSTREDLAILTTACGMAVELFSILVELNSVIMISENSCLLLVGEEAVKRHFVMSMILLDLNK